MSLFKFACKYDLFFKIVSFFCRNKRNKRFNWIKIFSSDFYRLSFLGFAG